MSVYLVTDPAWLTWPILLAFVIVTIVTSSLVTLLLVRLIHLLWSYWL